MQQLKNREYEWIEIVSAEELGSEKLEVLASVKNPTLRSSRSAHKWVLGCVAFYFLIRGATIVSQELGSGRYLLLFGSLALGVAGAAFIYFVNKRNLSYLRSRMEKNKGREILKGPEMLCISAGEMIRDSSNLGGFLSGRVFKEIRETGADYLLFRKGAFRQLYVSSDTLEIYPEDSRCSKFTLDLFRTEWQPEANVIASRLQAAFPFGKLNTQALASRDSMLIVVFMLSLVAIVLFKFFLLRH